MLQDTISYVSVSDPAPLPRLGEVFFDVRGNSRSMRLSWYADTGVAVFSIWQAGMCTGTFRLPMADLSRMIEILERGPAPRGRGRAPVSAAPHGEDRGSDSDWYYGPDGDEPARPGGPGNRADYGAEYPAVHGPPGYEAGYGRSERGSGDYGAAEHRSAEYGAAEHRSGDYGSGGYGQSGPGGAADHHGADVDRTGYGVSGDRPADHGAADERYHRADYGSAGQAAGSDDYGAEAYPADYGRGGYGESGGPSHGYQQGGYEQGGYEQGGYEQGGYEQGGYEQGGYEQGGYEQGGYEQGGYGSGAYGSSGYGAAEADYRTGEYSGHPDDRRAGSDRGYLPGDYDDRQEFRSGAGTDSSGYREERSVAPYVGDSGPAYPNDNPAGGGYQRDIDDAAYPADRRPVSSSDRYPDPSAPAEEYSYGAEYRHR